jgi:hypothetical protein
MGLKITMNKWQCKTGEAVARKLAAAAALKADQNHLSLNH